MLQTRSWLACLTLLLGAGVASAQDESLLAGSQIMQAAQEVSPSPVAPPTKMPLMPMTMDLDASGFPPPGPPWSLFSPFELYARVGPAFIMGDGVLDKALRTGKAVTGGARSFCFNSDNSAAWTGDLAIEYIYNDSQTSETILVRNTTVVVTRFGQNITLPMEVQYALRQLHRTSMKIALGREWYFGGEGWGGVRLAFGLDGGGKYGSASAKLGINRRIIEGQQQFDTLPSFDDGHTTSALKGVLVGVNAALLFPMDGYDISFGARFEWGKDWFLRIATGDDGVEQIQTLITVGVRY
jgi:hypothetical protein